MPSRFPCQGATDGSDLSGEIIELGPSVARGDLKIGDRVCRAVHASNPACLQSGSFAEYLVTYADLALRVQDSMSWVDAAAIGGCVQPLVEQWQFSCLRRKYQSTVSSGT